MALSLRGIFKMNLGYVRNHVTIGCVCTNLKHHVIGPFTHCEDHKSRYKDARRHQDVISKRTSHEVGHCSVCGESEHEKLVD